MALPVFGCDLSACVRACLGTLEAHMLMNNGPHAQAGCKKNLPHVHQQTAMVSAGTDGEQQVRAWALSVTLATAVSAVSAVSAAAAAAAPAAAVAAAAVAAIATVAAAAAAAAGC